MPDLEQENLVKRTDPYTIDQLEWLIQQAEQRGIIANNPARTHFTRVCQELIDAIIAIQAMCETLDYRAWYIQQTREDF